MEKYKVQMINKYTEAVEDDMVDGMVFNSEEDAEDYAGYMNSCNEDGLESLKRMNPVDYDEDYGHNEAQYYIVTELD